MTTTIKEDFDVKARGLSKDLDAALDAATILSPSPSEAALAAQAPKLRKEAAALFKHSLNPAQRVLYECLMRRDANA